MLKKPTADIIELSRYDDRRQAPAREGAGTGEIVLFTGVRYERIEERGAVRMREAL